MTTEERKDLVAYRLEKALKTLEEVKGVSSLGYWSLVANRLYYAAYYASAALLIQNGIDASTHRGVLRMVGSTFVKNGILTTEDSKLLGILFTMRQTGDYEDLFDWEEGDVVPLISRVEDYVDRIRLMIKE